MYKLDDGTEAHEMVKPKILRREDNPFFDHLERVPVLVSGAGNIDLLCGHCNHVIVKDYVEGSLIDVILRCSHCGADNEIMVA